MFTWSLFAVDTYLSLFERDGGAVVVMLVMDTQRECHGRWEANQSGAMGHSRARGLRQTPAAKLPSNGEQMSRKVNSSPLFFPMTPTKKQHFMIGRARITRAYINGENGEKMRI